LGGSITVLWGDGSLGYAPEAPYDSILVAAGAPEGFVKLIGDAGTGRILGGHLLGEHVSELIAPLTLAIRWGLTAQQWGHTVFAHPTLSEALAEAAEGLIGKPTHFLSRT